MIDDYFNHLDYSDYHGNCDFRAYCHDSHKDLFQSCAVYIARIAFGAAKQEAHKERLRLSNPKNARKITSELAALTKAIDGLSIEAYIHLRIQADSSQSMETFFRIENDLKLIRDASAKPYRLNRACVVREFVGIYTGYLIHIHGGVLTTKPGDDWPTLIEDIANAVEFAGIDGAGVAQRLSKSIKEEIEDGAAQNAYKLLSAGFVNNVVH